jgi:Mrp family chromosome partitioning ATPase
VAVDLDLRKPGLHTYLNADREPGTRVLEALLSSATPENGATAEAIDDGVILVVDSSGPRRRHLLAAKRQLAYARAELLGTVLNRAAVDLPVYSNGSRSTRSLDAAGARQEDGPMRGARTALP